MPISKRSQRREFHQCSEYLSINGNCFCERFVSFAVTGPREARRSQDEAGRLNPRRHLQIEILGEAKPGEAGTKPALLSHVTEGQLVKKVVRPGFYIYYYIEGGVGQSAPPRRLMPSAF